MCRDVTGQVRRVDCVRTVEAAATAPRRSTLPSTWDTDTDPPQTGGFTLNKCRMSIQNFFCLSRENKELRL